MRVGRSIRTCRPGSPATLELCRSLGATRAISYRELDAASSRLAANLARHGLGIGDTALVQLPNVAEFYLVFFALLKAGIAPVNALFSHNRLELLSYAEQITPRLFIGSLAHPLFASKGRESELLTTIGAELVLLDGDVATGRFEVSDAALFQLGATVSIALRWEGEDSDVVVFEGLVMRQTVSAAVDGTRLQIELLAAALHGAGGAEPIGLAVTSGINATVTYGGAATWADVVEHETAAVSGQLSACSSPQAFSSRPSAALSMATAMSWAV